MSKELKLEDYKAFYEKFADSNYAKAYMTLHSKFEELCDEFSKYKIDIADEESALFKNFLAFSKQSKSLLEDMDEIMSKIDKSRAAEIKAKQRETGRLSVEAMVRNMKDNG